MSRYRKINIGDKIGKLTVISEVLPKNKNGLRFLCKCDCGNDHSVLSSHLRSSKITHCGCQIKYGPKHGLWTGAGEISSGFWYDKIIRSASGQKGNRRVKEVDITIVEAWDLFLKQDRKCALSGIILKFPEKSSSKDYTASLDRIDSSKDYVLGNVQWVHKHINIMKNKFDNQYFINMCKLIAENYGGK